MFRTLLKTSIRNQAIATHYIGYTPSKTFKMPLVTIASNISEALKKSEIIPDVLSDFSPNGLITVSYGKDKEVTLGNTLKVSETQEKPEINITLSESEPEDTFTLVLTDPDAPTRGDKKWSEYCHYIASGIKPKTSGGEVIPVDYSSATELISYQGPAPPPGTGKHRYVFLLLKETSGTTPKVFQGERPTWGTNVPGSGVRDWAAKNKLSPVAVNFFYAQNENQSKSE